MQKKSERVDSLAELSAGDVISYGYKLKGHRHTVFVTKETADGVRVELCGTERALEERAGELCLIAPNGMRLDTGRHSVVVVKDVSPDKTCKDPRCDNPPLEAGETYEGENGREYTVRRGFCSPGCEIRYEHIEADARNARRDAEREANRGVPDRDLPERDGPPY